MFITETTYAPYAGIPAHDENKHLLTTRLTLLTQAKMQPIIIHIWMKIFIYDKS